MKKWMCWFLLLSVNSVLVYSPLSFASNPCEIKLTQTLTPQEMGELRALLIGSSKNYAKDFPERRVSLFRGTEFKSLPVLSLKNSHMFYIAAGGDVWRGLVDFPGAENYHFLDKLTGWGKSPLHLLHSIRHRLERFSVSVEIIDSGFLDELQEVETKRFETLLSAKYLEGIEAREKSKNKKPLVLQFKIRLPSSKKLITKHLYIHRFDLGSDEDFQNLFHWIGPVDPLLGVLSAGITGNPNPKNLNEILNRLHPSGQYIKEWAGIEYNPHFEHDTEFSHQLKNSFMEYLERNDVHVQFFYSHKEYNLIYKKDTGVYVSFAKKINETVK